MNPWDRRIERARQLEKQHPAAAEILLLYARIAEFQKNIARANAPREALRRLLQQAAPQPLSSNPPAEFLDCVLAQASGRACPDGHAKPVAAVLRPEGEGAKRSLLCSWCLFEWDFGRMVCPHCGEEREAQLPVFSTEQFPHVRIAACETCRYYIKTVDLTRDGLAVPEVDELAALALDLWASERGYTKVQSNVFGL